MALCSGTRSIEKKKRVLLKVKAIKVAACTVSRSLDPDCIMSIDAVVGDEDRVLSP